VPFESLSFRSPQYYGWRVGRFFGRERRWGVELEFTHPKVYALTSAVVPTRGRFRGAPVDGRAALSTYVERYSMSHGLNFVLVNVLALWPIGDPSGGSPPPVHLVARAGAGPVVPHSETVIGGERRFLYEVAGVGVQAAIGASIRLRGRLSATVDYKLGWARPEITIVDGTGRTTAVVHQVAVGVAIGISRW
jgi:hypothetical protein